MSDQVSGTSLAEAYPVLKDWYANQQVRNLQERKHPLYAMMKKNTDFSGRVYPQPMSVATTSGSAQFSNAQTNQRAVKNVEFNGSVKFNYALATVQNAALQASRNDRGAFINVLKQALNGAFENATMRDAWQLYRTGTGAIGSYTSAHISTGVITLDNPTDALAFQYGQTLVASQTDGGALEDGVGYVVGADATTGKIVVSTTPGGSPGNPTGWTGATHYLYSQGDTNEAIEGLGIWMPDAGSALRPAVGTAKTFQGVDRSIDPTRLAGTALDLSAEDIESAFIDLISQVKMLGGSPEFVFTNTISYRNLQKALQARHQYTEAMVESTAGITFRGFEVSGAVVLEDADCPARRAYALQMDTWELFSYGMSPQFLTYTDGNDAFRVATADSLEGRVGGYRNLTCNAPVKNGTAILPV